MSAWVLGVDLGSSMGAVAAAGRVELLGVAGQPLAEPVPARTALVALLEHFVAAAQERFAGSAPSTLVLAHPAAWDPGRCQMLRNAAERMLPAVDVRLLPEPVAVAVHHAAEHTVGDASANPKAVVAIGAAQWGAGAALAPGDVPLVPKPPFHAHGPARQLGFAARDRAKEAADATRARAAAVVGDAAARKASRQSPAVLVLGVLVVVLVIAIVSGLVVLALLALVAAGILGWRIARANRDPDQPGAASDPEVTP